MLLLIYLLFRNHYLGNSLSQLKGEAGISYSSEIDLIMWVFFIVVWGFVLFF